jgi:tRNA(fMet)-specific endonuclease VapC
VAEPRYLLDTNVCIYLLEGLSEPAREKVETFAPGEVVTSAICQAELLRGVDRSNRAALIKTERLFEVVPVMDFDSRAAVRYGALAFRRHSFDRLIAAHALALNLALVTNNEADFADVPELKLENWTV